MCAITSREHSEGGWILDAEGEHSARSTFAAHCTLLARAVRIRSPRKEQTRRWLTPSMSWACPMPTHPCTATGRTLLRTLAPDRVLCGTLFGAWLFPAARTSMLACGDPGCEYASCCCSNQRISTCSANNPTPFESVAHSAPFESWRGRQARCRRAPPCRDLAADSR